MGVGRLGMREPGGSTKGRTGQCGSNGAVGWRSSSMRAASWKSASVTPPSEWVDRASVTLFQRMSMSGWWPVTSAASATSFTNVIARKKSLRTNVLTIWLPRRSQPGRRCRPSSPPSICRLIPPSPPRRKSSLCSMPAPSEHEPRTSSSARPLNDGSHLLSVERFHGLCPDVAKRAKLKQCGGGGLVVREVDDSNDVVLAECPKNLTNLAAVLLDEAPEVLGPTDGVAEILDALVGPIDQGDVGRHGPAPFGRADRSRHTPL